jgi:predicted phosphodiesterase
MTTTLLAALLIPLAALAAPPPDDEPASTEAVVVADTAASTTIFFLSDAHSRHRKVLRFVEEANRAGADLVLEGGDLVHDGTEAEFRRALAKRARLQMPWFAAPGNHDLEPSGEFDAPPPRFPRLRVVDHDDLRIVLIDNHDERIDDERFDRLEEALRTAGGRRVLVVMHVPALLARTPATLRLRHLSPFRLASPVMRDSAEVERFKGLMERFGVVAVLAGHTHFPDRVDRGSVAYVTAGSLGGLTPGLGIANEFVEITLRGRDVEVRRVPVNRPPRDPVHFLARAFRFYAELNAFNHREQGWTFVPSASVQLRSGVHRIERDGDLTVARAASSFERLLGERGRRAWVADLGIAAGEGTLAADLAVGARYRPVGDFNRNLFVGGSVTGNAGLLQGSGTAGIGARVGLGAEWRNLTLEVGRGRATNQRTAEISVGWRP